MWKAGETQHAVCFRLTGVWVGCVVDLVCAVLHVNLRSGYWKKKEKKRRKYWKPLFSSASSVSYSFNLIHNFNMLQELEDHTNEVNVQHEVLDGMFTFYDLTKARLNIYQVIIS